MKYSIIYSECNSMNRLFFTEKLSRKCSADDCDKIHYARGFCVKHYYRFHRCNKSNLKPKKIGMPNSPKCIVQDCTEEARQNGKCLGHKSIKLSSSKKLGTCCLNGCYKQSTVNGYCTNHYYGWMPSSKKKKATI